MPQAAAWSEAAALKIGLLTLVISVKFVKLLNLLHRENS
jgi:hypothetical protein